MHSISEKWLSGQKLLNVSKTLTAVLFLSAVVSGISITVNGDGGIDRLEHDSFSRIDAYAAQGSLTDCIEKNAIANEIQITGSAMKKATFEVSRFIPGYDAEDEDTVAYCALKLV